MQEKFLTFREKYPVFEYTGYHITKTETDGVEYIELVYDFSVPGLCEFHPSNKIRISNLDIVNPFDGPLGRRIAFLLGMVELVSYWKPMCSPKVLVSCGELTPDECNWWKTLYFGGLGEFFYTNNITTDFDSFMCIESGGAAFARACDFVASGASVVPVGGGKDSIVTMELIKTLTLADGSSAAEKAYCFTVNDQPAREDSAAAAGFPDSRIIRTYRTLDKNMLKLNAEGFLNGHTPFSAIVAFLSGYCAYLIGANSIVLSNESSANESNVSGSTVNHQYSKSYEFETDFSSYFKTLGAPIDYFSLLRPFNELQIAKQFSSYSAYRKIFKSCNAGSKKNVWCLNCAKCLFVYIILSPFLCDSEMNEIFGENLLAREDLRPIFDGLVGFSPVKPFECVGTHDEINAALCKTAENYISAGKELPTLLSYYYAKVPHDNEKFDLLLKEFNNENSVPIEFVPAVKEMYRSVSE